MTPSDAYLALNMIPELGPVTLRAAVEHLGSPQAVWQADAGDLASVPGVGRARAAKFVQAREGIDPDHERRRAAGIGAEVLTWADDTYPECLAAIHDPPPVLYVLGNLQPADRHSLAIVGSRRCTHYGRGVADRLAFELARTGYTVVSGLARGIDAAAHAGALKARGRTIAVLGAALDRLYPPEHEKLAAEIAVSGAVISEFPMGREPDRTTFPYRNRVISGLSQGVVVVEASPSSGAMRTAEDAAEQGRSVFAVPGRIDSAGSRGCHRLIKDGARLVEGIDDVLEEFELLLPPDAGRAREQAALRPEVQLNDDERVLVEALALGALDIDGLARAADMPVSRVSGLLVGLELKRVVCMLPGRRVELATGITGLDAGEAE